MRKCCPQLVPLQLHCIAPQPDTCYCCSPMRPLEANDNLPTPAWFNIPSFLKSANVAKVDEQGMIDSVNAGTYIHTFRRHIHLTTYYP